MSIYNKYGRRPTVECGESITEQSHKDTCDVNCILKNYRRTGNLTHVRESEGQYMDVVDSVDFQKAMNIVAAGRSAFSSLPAHVRRSFNDDPAKYLAFQDAVAAERERVAREELERVPPGKAEPSPNPGPDKATAVKD